MNNLKKRYQPKKGKKQLVIVPKRHFYNKYPKTFMWGGTVTCLLIFYSRPIYDALFRTEFTPTPETPEARREAFRQAWKI